LLGIDDFETALLIIKQNGLLIWANHQVIGMGHDERLLIAEHDPNWSKGLSIHQSFNLICDHRGGNLAAIAALGNPLCGHD